MIRGLMGKVRTTFSNPLYSRGTYRFMNEVPKFDPSKDYYKILGVAKGTSDNQMKKSYYTLAKKYHPDSQPGFQNKFKQINEAYTVLSDSQVKKQYDASRVMRGFSERMSNKANQGSWNYQEYRSEYTTMSPQEQEQLVTAMRQKIKKVLIFGIVMLVVLPFITRRNHRFYILDHGQLVPVEFEGGAMGGVMPQPGMMGPHGQAPYPGQSGMGQPGMGQQQYQPYGQPQHHQGAYMNPNMQQQYAPPPGYRQ